MAAGDGLQAAANGPDARFRLNHLQPGVRIARMFEACFFSMNALSNVSFQPRGTC